MASEQRQEEVRTRLLEAIEGVTEGGEGLGDVSVEKLAKAAGISRATFYIYFSDKGDLLTARFEQVVAELLDAAGGWWNLGPEVSLDDLKAALARMAADYQPHSTLIAAVYDEAAYNPAVREQVAGLIKDGISGLRDHIERGQREGFVDPELLAPETAAWLAWMVERGLRDVVGPAPEPEVGALVAAQADVVWHTLYAFD
jgi:TetR/AcrR family transcriptional regulator, ethionamide resistance regulator